MLEIANISHKDKIADLGCGNMKILLQLEKNYGITGTGFEISPIPYLLARIKLYFRNTKNKIKFKNIFKANLSKFNVIFIYLTPPILKKLENKLIKECPKGTKIISNTFSLP
ncbi:MAG: hypothetical protein ACMXYK_04235, partial [Candidatus Woesearchaeota archaeon]